MTSTGITNWPAPARLTVGIVSAGRVGTTIGEALERADHVVGAVAASSTESRRRAAERLPESEILAPHEVAGRCELLVLAVPDDRLPLVISDLAASGSVRPGTIVAHTAGAQGVRVLDPLTDIGALPLALHPAMTFIGTGEDTDRLNNCCFGVTAADEVGLAIGQSLVLEMGGEPVHIREDDRTLYHAALAHGANHLVALVCDAAAALATVLDGQDVRPQRLLGPLLTAALDNTLQSGPAALTGPVKRGDAAAVARHLEALAAADQGIADGYLAMARRAAAYTNPPSELIELLGGDR
ncbi:Rossmann-like and DUF2520 domain-containing protein [Williamsia sp.]|uniref:Rossmann-like and DUF2520 domain-containing protein n=1 Tax=Williamsia sp. TaxID=1872085 RepID=UPI002F9492C8